MIHRKKHLSAAIGLTAAATLALAGCGSSSGGSTSSPAAAPSSSAASPSESSSTTAAGGYDPAANVAALYTGTFTNPPTDSPKPATGKNIWVISADQSLISAANTAAAIEAAGEKLGWTVNVVDSKLDPAAGSNGIQQAVAAKADAIVSIYWDCAAVKAGLLQAKGANVLRIGVEVADCDGEQLYDYIVAYNALPEFYGGLEGTMPNQLNAWQRALADYAVDKIQGQGKILFVTEYDSATLAAQSEGGLDQLSKCSGCTVVPLEITLADYGPPLQQKIQDALVKHPDIAAFMVESDFVLSLGGIAALKAAGLWGKVVIAGGEGSAESVKLMRDYPAPWAFSVLPSAWEGYAAADAANRLFNGQQPAAQTGMGLQLADKEHNLPADDVLRPTANGVPIDFAAEYETAWANGN